MEPLNLDNERLKKALTRAHKNAVVLKTGAAWEHGVMRDIRKLPAFTENTKNTENGAVFLYYEKFFWRFATVAGVLIVVLTALLLNVNVAVEYEMADMLMADPYSLTFAEAF